MFGFLTFYIQDVDFEKLATETDDQLVALSEKWFAILATTDMSDPQNRFRTGLLRLAYSYGRLIALSFGFQHHFSKNHTIENPFFLRVRAFAKGGSFSLLIHYLPSPSVCVLQLMSSAPLWRISVAQPTRVRPLNAKKASILKFLKTYFLKEPTFATVPKRRVFS